jgi:DNA modification methylase
MGSGTTGIAAVIDGYNFIGIDSNDNYVNISKKRIEASLSK